MNQINPEGFRSQEIKSDFKLTFSQQSNRIFLYSYFYIQLIAQSMYFNQYFVPYYPNVTYHASLDPNSEAYTNFLMQNPYFYNQQIQMFDNHQSKMQQNYFISSSNVEIIKQTEGRQDSQVKQSSSNVSDVFLTKKKKSIQLIQRQIFKQKQGRNVISNVFRQFLKFILTDKPRTLKMIEKISKRQNLQINAREYIQLLSKKNKNLKNYVRISQINNFMHGNGNDKSKNQAKIIRILLEFYLKENMVCSLCWNTKITGANRRLHIVQSRKFFDLIKN